MAQIPLADFNEAYARRKAGKKQLSDDAIESIRACDTRAEVLAILAGLPQKKAPRSPKTAAKRVKKVEKNGEEQ